MSKRKAPTDIERIANIYLSTNPHSLDIPISKGFLLEEGYFMLHLQGY